MAAIVRALLLAFLRHFLAAVADRGERDGLREPAIELVHLPARVAVAADVDQLVVLARPGHRCGGGEEREPARQLVEHGGQRGHRVRAARARVLAVRDVTLAGADREHARADPRVVVDGGLDRAGRGLDGDVIAALQAELRGRRRVHLDPRVPHHLGHRVGQLLEPRLVRAAAVAEHR